MKEMAKRMTLFLLWLAVVANLRLSWGSEMAEDNTRYAVRKTMDRIKDTASRTRDMMSSAEREASRYASRLSKHIDDLTSKKFDDMTSEARGNVENYLQNAYANAHEKAIKAMKTTSNLLISRKFDDMTSEARENVENYLQNAYANAHEKVIKAMNTTSNLLASKKFDDMTSVARENVENYVQNAYANAHEKAIKAMKMASNILITTREKWKKKNVYAHASAMDMDRQTKEMVKDQTLGKASDKGLIGKQPTMDESLSSEDNAYDIYEDAKAKVHETYFSAKETMTVKAKEKYEIAKEKASQNVGNLGAKMRDFEDEL